MAGFLDLSAELIQCVLEEVNPTDLASLALSCKTLNSFVNQNRLLWKQVYLKNHVSSISAESHDSFAYECTG
jgi:hypothetical protein